MSWVKVLLLTACGGFSVFRHSHFEACGPLEAEGPGSPETSTFANTVTYLYSRLGVEYHHYSEVNFVL